MSKSVAESKRRNVFLQELTRQRNFTNPAVQVKSAWLERRWTHTGYRQANTAIISQPNGYISLVVILSRTTGDTILYNATANQFPDAHTQNVAWFITPRPSAQTLTFKLAHNDRALPNDSCTLVLPSAAE